MIMALIIRITIITIMRTLTITGTRILMIITIIIIPRPITLIRIP